MTLRNLLISIAFAGAVTSGCGAAPECPPPAATMTTPSVAPLPPPAPTFDADAAFLEFERELRAWYAYLDRADFDVDALLARAGAAARQTRDAEAFRAVLLQATYAFTDPHLLVGPPRPVDFNVGPTSADLAIAMDAEGARVVDVRANSSADHAGVRPGWRLVAVGGMEVETVVAEVLALLPEPTDRQRSYAATLVANGRREAPRALTFETPEGVRTPALDNPRTFARALEAAPPLEASLHDGVALIRLNNALGRTETVAAFDAAVAASLSAHTLVLDLRNTPSGGNTDVARGVMGHFVNSARPYQMHEIPGIERRTTVPRRFVEYVLPREPYFPGRLVVFGGRWTGSMGEGTVIGLQAAAGATVFASDLGDLLGALHALPLPASEATLELGAEALFHVNGTPRAEFVAEQVLETADRDSQGDDPAWTAFQAWLKRYPR